MNFYKTLGWEGGGGYVTCVIDVWLSVAQWLAYMHFIPEAQGLILLWLDFFCHYVILQSYKHIKLISEYFINGNLAKIYGIILKGIGWDLSSVNETFTDFFFKGEGGYTYDVLYERVLL